MVQFAYLCVLLACLVGTMWLELLLRTRVYRRFLRLVATVFPVVVIFSIWDFYAISRGHWYFSPRHLTGHIAFWNIPIEEIAFFVVIPICAVLTLEAVRSARGWKVGDE